jgi:hypothetical protein
MMSFPLRAHPRSKTAADALAEQVVVPWTRSGLSTLWIPMDALTQAWATFGVQATSAPALAATGMAL